MRGNPAEAPIWYVAFLFSLTCHEAAHALAAKIGGDDTAYNEGQVSLNPLPHIRREPFGTVLVPLLSYMFSGWMIGWGSAPYDPTWQARYPHRAAWMALAGPVANFLIVILTGIAIHAFIAAGVLDYPSRLSFTSLVSGADPASPSGLAVFLSVLFCLNLLLGVFNLIPVPPLDGATAIGLLMSEETALRFYDFMRQPTLQIFGILIAWQLLDYIFRPVFIFAISVLY